VRGEHVAIAGFALKLGDVPGVGGHGGCGLRHRTGGDRETVAGVSSGNGYWAASSSAMEQRR
jgi:hypothetical protein